MKVNLDFYSVLAATESRAANSINIYGICLPAGPTSELGLRKISLVSAIVGLDETNGPARGGQAA